MEENMPCPKCGCDNHAILNASMPTINQCCNCKHMWNPDNITHNVVTRIGNKLVPMTTPMGLPHA